MESREINIALTLFVDIKKELRPGGPQSGERPCQKNCGGTFRWVLRGAKKHLAGQCSTRGCLSIQE